MSRSLTTWLPAVLVWLTGNGLLGGCTPAPTPAMALANYDYHDVATRGHCAPATRPGAAGASDQQSTPEGVRYALRAPRNYRPESAHPLLVVYAPAGYSAAANERYTGLTAAATGRGFLVVYTAAQPPSLAGIRALAQLPAAVAARWCVAPKQIYATGHSDGGTATTAIAVLPALPHPFAAIAPSAAGFTAEDLRGYRCPQPVAVMVLHNAGDELFPGWGAQAARWWAQCNGCAVTATTRDPGGCLRYAQCPAGADTRYCEHPGDHRYWPATAAALLDFFQAAPTRATGPTQP